MMNDRSNQRSRQDMRAREPKEFEEKVIQVNRVSKKTKGGNQMGFSVLVVVGDKKGRVGVGLGKAKDVLSSIQKAVKKAKRKLLNVPIQGTTIPFPITVKFGAANILLKPAPAGSGIIAGGAVRAVVDAAGIRDISSKIKGTSNPASNVYATLEALKKLRMIVDKKGITLKSVIEAEKAEKEKMREHSAKQQDKKEEQQPQQQPQEQKPVKPVAKRQVKKGIEKPVAVTTEKAEKTEKPVEIAQEEKKEEVETK